MKNLETDRFHLRQLVQGDEKYFLDLDSDPAVMTWINGGVPSTLAECEAAVGRIQKVIEDSDGKYGIWQVFTKDTTEYVGWVLFRPDKKDPTNMSVVEVGYRLKQAWWGKGVATELARRMLEYGFNDLKVKEVFAVAMKANTASQNVMKKIGLKYLMDYQEDQFPLDNRDAVRFSLTFDAFYL